MEEQFSELERAFPEYKSLDDVPEEVINTSEGENISLFDAMLRYRFSQEQKIKAEQEKQKQNIQSSAGSLKSSDIGYAENIYSALVRGIRK